MNYLFLSSLSFFIGIIVGLTGIGGASLITPMLIFTFQVPAAVAISSDVVAATMMKIVGGWKHWRQQTLDRQAVKWLACGSVPGALTGVGILHLIKGVEGLDINFLLLRCLGVALLLVTTAALVKYLLLTWAPQMQLPALPKLDLETRRGRILAVGVGAILGFLVGMTSVSSGCLFALVLITLFQLEPQKLVGTDIAQASILLSFTSLGHLSLGTVDWSLVVPIWIGSVPGVILGARLCKIVPQRPLQLAIYSLLILISYKLVITSSFGGAV